MRYCIDLSFDDVAVPLSDYVPPEIVIVENYVCCCIALLFIDAKYASPCALEGDIDWLHYYIRRCDIFSFTRISLFEFFDLNLTTVPDDPS